MGSSRLPLFSLVMLSSLGISYCHDVCSCEPVRCGRDGPEIRFPFRVKDRQPQCCGYSQGFDLSCQGKDKNSFIYIPSLGQEFIVHAINYTEQRLEIGDPDDCLWGILFNHTNFSASPFRYYYGSYNWTFVKCSKNVDFNYLSSPIDCLSDAGHDVFALSSDTSINYLPVSCQPIKTITMPESYSMYYSMSGREDHLRINLWWLKVPGCKDCESRGEGCAFKNETRKETMCFSYDKGKGLKTKHVIIGLKTKQVIIGASVGSFLLLATILTTIKVYLSWKLNKKLDLENKIKVEKFLEDYKSLKPTRYSYADLKKMTDQFKEKLGEGGYGTVFKGKLPNGTSVAVKILKMIGGEGEEFINEVGTIGKIHHVNVVRLLGFCVDRLKRALIYEFMPNESLEKFIFSRDTNDHFLSWEKLQDIAIGVARGIEYLHQGCEQRILHFDIKPHNILLDQNFNPKICDFGLAKLCSKGKSMVSMTATRGTMGYIAPEVFSRNFGNVSYKSDVFSFGMLLLEMVGGRKNIDVTVENTSQVYFPEWIYKRLHQGEEMGLNFATDEDAKIAKKLTIVALWCIQWHPVDRPSMESVVQMFEENMESLVMPPDPFASTAPARTGVEKTQITNLSTISE